tara:strand:+ start:260 stop:622 length:363 start_codon:yes stop_codon:yes gene_type:complete
MIDTGKYEGHDLAKGRVGSDYNIYDRKGNIIFDVDDVGSNMATLNLLADAPLLLEEVKRLREENKELEEFLNKSHAANKIRHEQLVRAQKWAYKQVCHNDSAMMDYDDYVWGEEDVDISN